MVEEFPFRVGATSYIIPDNLAANARYLSERVQDMELVLFDLEDGQSNLPDAETAAELRRMAGETGLSYTVHLLIDVHGNAAGEEEHISLRKARQVIELTRGINPFAYVLHLDGREVRANASPAELVRWQVETAWALEQVAGWAGGFQRLAVENLEGYPLDFIEPVLEQVPASRCIDIGHLWLDGHDPLPYLERAFARTRVVHLHGLAGRDHQSLAHTPPEQIDRVIRFLVDNDYSGVVTMEIFGEADFHSSLQALRESCRRMQWA